MGLTSSLSTALTGLNAAETQIDVLGNNLANSQTVGFKSSDVVFANQFLQTLALGAAPTADNGGTNPRQTGLGVQVAAINAQSLRKARCKSAPPHPTWRSRRWLLHGAGSNDERLFTRNGKLQTQQRQNLSVPTVIDCSLWYRRTVSSADDEPGSIDQTARLGSSCQSDRERRDGRDADA